MTIVAGLGNDAMESKPLAKWITIPAAARELGVGLPAVRSLIAEGRLTVRSVPGSYPRVLAAEVAVLADRCTSAAKAC